MGQELHYNFLVHPGVYFPLINVYSTMCVSKVVRLAQEGRKKQGHGPFLHSLQHYLFPSDSEGVMGKLVNLLRLAVCLSPLIYMLSKLAQLSEAPGRFQEKHKPHHEQSIA